MKLNRVISLTIVVIFSCLLFVGCRDGGDAKKVVFIAQMSTGDYWENLSDSINKEAVKAGYKYKFTGPKEWNAKQQAKVIEKAVKEKPAAIILAPIGNTDLFSAIKKANDADIPVILIDNDMNRELLDAYGAYVTTYVGIDNYDGGVKVADEFTNNISKSDKVAVFYGNVTSENSENRCNGFYDTMTKNGFDVVETLTANSEDESYEKAKLLIAAHPDIKAIFTANSGSCKGVLKAAEEANLQIKTGTFDCDDDILKGINEGKIICTFDQNSEGMSKGAIEVVDKLSKGEKVKSVTVTEGKLITK